MEFLFSRDKNHDNLSKKAVVKLLKTLKVLPCRILSEPCIPSFIFMFTQWWIFLQRHLGKDPQVAALFFITKAELNRKHWVDNKKELKSPQFMQMIFLFNMVLLRTHKIYKLCQVVFFKSVIYSEIEYPYIYLRIAFLMQAWKFCWILQSTQSNSRQSRFPAILGTPLECLSEFQNAYPHLNKGIITNQKIPNFPFLQKGAYFVHLLVLPVRRNYHQWLILLIETYFWSIFLLISVVFAPSR